MSKHEYDLSFVDNIPPVDPHSQLGIEGDGAWRVNNSTFQEYAADVQLSPYYPEGLEGIVEEALAAHDTNVGLDIAGGSQAQALRDLVDRGILTKGLVTNLEDLRTPETKADTRIDHIAGDLALRRTWDGIVTWQTTNAPEGLALVMHRPFGAMQDFPPAAYDGAAHTLLDMIRPGGVLFTQVPKRLFAWPPDALAIYRGLLERPDVDDIILSTRSSFDEGGQAYAVIIKDS